ncbi:transposase [Kitasatospora phosalacinea]|uniref:IS701 family transposase n=1 Tax=Kitasatospora phosalacinea TaxID=2065 RepID=UPI00365DC115
MAVRDGGTNAHDRSHRASGAGAGPRTHAAPWRDGLSAYCRELFSDFARSDQRGWGEVYLRGLLHAPGRKTPAAISEQVLGRRAVQPIQQFVSQSTWEARDVRRRLAELVGAAAPPQAWSVQDVVFPKNGTRSAGVARQFVATEGRVMNCQLAIATSLVTPYGSQPVDWRLVLPRQWDTDERLRSQAHVPAGVRGLPRHRLVLDSLDGMLDDWDVPVAPVLADWSHEGEAEPLLAGLEERGLDYLVQVGPATVLAACAPGARRAVPTGPRGRPTGGGRRAAAVHRRAAELAGEPGARAVLPWRGGPGGRARPRFSGARTQAARRSRCAGREARTARWAPACENGWVRQSSAVGSITRLSRPSWSSCSSHSGRSAVGAPVPRQIAGWKGFHAEVSTACCGRRSSSPIRAIGRSHSGQCTRTISQVSAAPGSAPKDASGAPGSSSTSERWSVEGILIPLGSGRSLSLSGPPAALPHDGTS